MKKHLPLFYFFMSALLPLGAFAQADRFAYAITDQNQDGANWNFLRKLDLNTGAFSEVILKGNDATALSYDALSKKRMTAQLTDERFGTIANAAFGTGVAAIAYDKKNDRLYYTPMFIDQLRYIDLRTMRVYFVNNVAFTGMKVKAVDQSNIVTRMAIASDGNGYALTNDGTHLIKFSTGKKVTVSDLGTLVDDPANGSVSIHNACSSFGGDMIADDAGNLYLFSARNHVFRVDTKTKLATHLGVASGLPAAFTINGAAVDADNRILVSSAIDNSSLYTLDAKTWAATAAKTGPWKVADLANSNLLLTARSAPTATLLKTDEGKTDMRVQLFPNPSTNRQFNLQFDLPEGRYAMLITDALGRQTSQASFSLKGKGQLEQVVLPASSKVGVYNVRIMDENKKEVYSKKLLLQ